MNYRIESDSIGTKQVPANAYYGVQSLRGCENFQITGQRLRPEFIVSLAEIKKACAICNKRVGELDGEIADAISRSATRSSPVSSTTSSSATPSRAAPVPLPT